MAGNDLNILINLLVKNQAAAKSISADVDKINTSAKNATKSVDSLTTGFGKLIAFFVGAAGLKKAIEQFDQLDDATNRLSIAIERNTRLGEDFNDVLDDQAAKLSRNNNFTVAAVKNLQALTANLGLAKDQTVSLNDAIANLADRSGQDLTTVTKGVEALIRTGEAARGLRLEGIDTTGFANLSSGQRAAAFAAQVPTDNRNGNELKQFLVQIDNLFANLGKTLNTILGPALTFINNILSAINKSPVLSSIVGTGIIGGALITSIGALIRALEFTAAAFTSSKTAGFFSNLFGSAAGSTAGGTGSRFAFRALSGLTSANRALGGGSRTEGFAADVFDKTVGKAGQNEGIASFLSGAVLAGSALLRFAGIIGLIVTIVISLYSAFQGLLDIIGPSNVDIIKRGFGSFVDFMKDLPGLLVDLVASIFSSDSFEEIRRQRKAADDQLAIQKGGSSSSAPAGGLASSIDPTRTDRLKKVRDEQARLEQGFVGRSFVQGSINELNASSKEDDRIEAIRLQNQLLQARISNLQKEYEIYGEEKEQLDSIGELNETDLARSKELITLRSEVVDKMVQINSEQRVNNKNIDTAKFALEREVELLDESLGLEIKKAGGLNAQITLQEQLSDLQQKIIDNTLKGVRIDDGKIERLREIYTIQAKILQVQQDIAQSEKESVIALAAAANKAKTNPQFGDAGKNFNQQLDAANERLAKANQNAQTTTDAFFAGNASRDQLSDAIGKVQEANAAVIALKESSSQLSDVVGDNLVSSFDKIVDGTANASEAIRDLVTGILGDLAKVFIRLASMRVATSLFGGGTASGQGFADLISFFPTGGIVSGNDGPQVSGDGHRLVAVQPGELILNKAQQRSLASGVQSSGVILNNINTFNDNDLYRAMQKTGGQSVTINNIRSNPSAVRGSF